MPVDCLKGTCFDHFWDLGPKSKAEIGEAESRNHNEIKSGLVKFWLLNHIFNLGLQGFKPFFRLLVQRYALPRYRLRIARLVKI